MIHVDIVDLSARGVILPNTHVGMVVAQPQVLVGPQAPYRWADLDSAKQLEILVETLRVARLNTHGQPKTHFTVFPEYSIPGLVGITSVQAALEETTWPTGTVVIGGVDALSKTDFIALAQQPGTHVYAADNTISRIADHEWINCAITWVKGQTGVVERWLQPKLARAWPELNLTDSEMFSGDSVFIFKGLFDNNTEYHFGSLVCFDWIARSGSQRIWQMVLNQLAQSISPREISLSWMFVIQHNPQPSHHTFLTEVSGFFDQNIEPNVRRDRTCLVLSNSAGKPQPGPVTSYGATSLIFSNQAQFSKGDCNLTFSNGGIRFRASNTLQGLRDVFLRECGGCIYSFAQVNPGSLVTSPVGRAFPIDSAWVFPLPGTIDLRAPGAPVAASLKWLYDQLETISGLHQRYPSYALSGHAGAANTLIIGALRSIPSNRIESKVRLATSKPRLGPPPPPTHADQWEQPETNAVAHLLHTLNFFALRPTLPAIANEHAHASLELKGHTVDLLAIRGDSHTDCIEHSKQFVPLPRRSVLLVSRDVDNTEWRQKLGSFLETEVPQIGGERKITTPQGGILHLGYQNILKIYQQAANAVELETALDAALVA